MKTVSITDYGAKADGSLCTAAIQAAIDDCFFAGGGEVQVPSGTFLTATIRLRSNITLHLLKGAVLIGSRNPEDYTYWLNDSVEPLTEDIRACKRAEADGKPTHTYLVRRWCNALIRVAHAENVSIIGDENSFLDGADCYDELGEEQYRGPHCIAMDDCKNIVLKGYSIRNSANWAHRLYSCQNILADSISVFGGHDGFHVRFSDNITVRNSVFNTGDDCIAGFDNQNVLVEDCEMNTACSAFRFGGTGVLIRRCRIFGPAKNVHRSSLTSDEKISGKITEGLSEHRYNMLSAFTYFAYGKFPIRSLPGEFYVEDCTVENADRFLHFNYSGNEIWQNNRPLKDIHFKNVKATGVRLPLVFYCDKEEPGVCEFTDCHIAFKGDAHFMDAANIERVTLNRTKVSGQNPVILKYTDGGVIEAPGVSVEKATESFFAQSI